MLCCSHSGIGSVIEPLPAVPLNDELQQARASVAKAEADVLLMLTEKVACRLIKFLGTGDSRFTSYVFIFLFSAQMQMDLGNIENLLNSIIRLDVVRCLTIFFPSPCIAS